MKEVKQPAQQTLEGFPLPDLAEHIKTVTSGSENRQRTHVKRCRYDDAELAEFHRRARERGLTDGSYIRAATIGDAGPRTRRRTTVDVTALMLAVTALNRVGANQRAIAKALVDLAAVAAGHDNQTLTELVAGLAVELAVLPEKFAEPVKAILATMRHDHEG